MTYQVYLCLHESEVHTSFCCCCFSQSHLDEGLHKGTINAHLGLMEIYNQTVQKFEYTLYD